MSLANHLDRLAPYVPATLMRSLKARGGDLAERVESAAGAVLLLDIAGFTPMVVDMNAEGPRGIDTLQRLLTEYFSEVIQALDELGGVVYQFAGDSVLACFEAAAEEEAAAVTRAAVCALEIQRRLGRFSNVEVHGRRFAVSSRVGISAGPFHRLVLGRADRWLHQVVVGAPVERAVAAEKLAKAGEVVLSAEAWAALPLPKGGVAVGSGHRLLESPPVASGWKPEPPDAEPARSTDARLISPALYTKIVTAVDDALGDFRDVTCLFVRCEGLSHHGEVRELAEDLNAFYEFLQVESAQYGGTLLQTDLTDKGDVFFVIFGAPTAQENKEVLAVRLASKLLAERPRFAKLTGLQAGIASGRAYCGTVGGKRRLAYTAVGEVVNLAARLMTYTSENGILVDESTAKRLGQDYQSTLLEMAKLKGVSRPVAIHQIQAEIRKLRSLFVEGRGEVVGRRKELEQLKEASRQAFTEGHGQLWVVTGEPGIGKSRVSARVVDDAPGFNAQMLYGIAYSYETFTPFLPWKMVLRSLFQIFDADPREVQVSKLRQELGLLTGVGPEWAPVLAGILGISVEEEPLTRAMDAKRKQQAVFGIVLELIRHRARVSPLLLFFEDMHWADTVSLDLLEFVCAQAAELPLLVLVTARPGEAQQRLGALQGSHLIELGHLEIDEARALLRWKVSLDPPSEELEALVLARAQGNPFYIESLAHSLFEQGHLVVDRTGEVRLARGLEEVSIPDSVQAVVLGRIDRLPEEAQAVLKAASVIGRVFTLEAVRPLLPLSFVPERLRSVIDQLNSLGLTVLESEQPISCLFKHIVIRDVAYETLLVSNREDLHRRYARSLETRSRDNLAGSAGILAYHFRAGSDAEKALEYSLLAAREAQGQYANRDAVYHYERALELLRGEHYSGLEGSADATRHLRAELAQSRVQAGQYAEGIVLFEQCLAGARTDPERAQVQVGLGRAHQEMGDTPKAIAALERALKLLGRRTPRSLVALGLGIVAQLFLRVFYAVFPVFDQPVAKGQLFRYRKQLSTLISLIKIYYFVDAAKLVWAVLLARRMAERTRSEVGLSLSDGYVGALLFGAGLMGPSRKACERSLERAKQSRDVLAEATALSRLGNHASFANDLEPGLALQSQAANLFRQVGDMWELQTSLMMLATTYFLRSDFHLAEPIYAEMGRIGRDLNAQMHQAWSHSWAPFCRYLRGELSGPDTLRELEQGLLMSEQVGDLANQCASLNHMANVAVREGEVELAAQLAVRSFASIWRYQVLVPFLQVGLVDAAEAALFALENGATSVARAKLRRVATLGTFKARGLARLYPYLRGPGLRVHARKVRLDKGVEAAEPLFEQAIAVLESTPNRWELGVAYLDAGLALPRHQEVYLARARALFERVGAQAELKRLDRPQVRARLAAGAAA